MLFETESFSVRSLLKGYGDNNVDGPNQYGSLRYTGLNKIPTISECFPYWKNAFPNLPVPSSIKETEPSKIWFLTFEANEKLRICLNISAVCLSGQRVRGVCNGDSGSPFFWEDKSDNDRTYLMAIMSKGGSICHKNDGNKNPYVPPTGVWVAAIYDWILSIGGQELYECSPWYQHCISQWPRTSYWNVSNTSNCHRVLHLFRQHMHKNMYICMENVL